MAAVHPRTQGSAAAQDSGALYRVLADSIPLMVWSADAGGNVDFVNRRALEYSGLHARGLEGWNWEAIVHPDDRERSRAVWTRALATGERLENDVRLRRADGAYRWHHVTGVPQREGHEGVVRWFGIGADVEDDVRTLRESERRFQAFMDNLPAAAWIKDHELRYRYVNRGYEEFYKRAGGDVLGLHDFDLHSLELASFLRDEDQAILRSGQAVQRTRELRDAGGKGVHWLVAKFPLTDAAGRTGVGGMAFDISSRVEAEEKARRHASEVRHLVGRLVQAQEAERRRVADELHGLIGQNLTALGIDLQALRQRLPASDTDAAARIAAMAGLLDTTMQAIRGVITDLRPAALDEFGLVPALRWYAALFVQRTGIKVTTEVAGAAERLSRDLELALFRIAQETLTNAAKHSGATQVRIAIRHGDVLRLTVEDDGRGFAPSAGARDATRGGFGLITMRERAEAFGGRLSVEFPGRGTRIVVEIPKGGDAAH